MGFNLTENENSYLKILFVKHIGTKSCSNLFPNCQTIANASKQYHVHKYAIINLCGSVWRQNVVLTSQYTFEKKNFQKNDSICIDKVVFTWEVWVNLLSAIFKSSLGYLSHLPAGLKVKPTDLANSWT